VTKEEGSRKDGRREGKEGTRREREGEISPPRSFLKVGAYGRERDAEGVERKSENVSVSNARGSPSLSADYEIWDVIVGSLPNRVPRVKPCGRK